MKATPMGRPAKSLLYVGQRVGMWTVLSLDVEKRANNYFALCQCDCGTTKLVNRGSLRCGDSKGCGCTKGEITRARSVSHGKSGTPEYRVWVGIKTRCRNEDHDSYAGYGAVGIDICDRWNDSFEAFLKDMGPRPSSQHSVERKDNDLGYSPDNCVWATRDVQANNKSNNVIVVLNEKPDTLANWCATLGLPYHAVYLRIFRRKWDPVKALTTPIRKVTRRNKEKNKNVTDK